MCGACGGASCSARSGDFDFGEQVLKSRLQNKKLRSGFESRPAALRAAIDDQQLRPARTQCRLACFRSCRYEGVLPGQDRIDEPDRDGGGVACAVLAGFLDAVGVVPGALDDAGVAALAFLVELARVGDVGHDAFEELFLLVRGKKPGRRPGG